jgi:hypothetical protein
MAEEKKLKTFSYGGCRYRGTSPPRARLSPETKVLNISIPFDQALRLNLALDECLRALNRLKGSTTEGKDAAVNLVVHFHVNRIAVAQAKSRRRLDAKGAD